MLVVERNVGVDRHGLFDVAVGRRSRERPGAGCRVEQERHTGVPEVVEPHLAEASDGQPRFPVLEAGLFV